jgi:hypothetical protein
VFREAIARVLLEKLVFLDECHFALNLHRLYGWTMGRTMRKVPFEKGLKRSAVGAFSCLVRTTDRVVGAVAKRACGTAPLSPCSWPRRCCPLCPQGRVGAFATLATSQPLPEATGRRGGMPLMFLPPYSPDFNPIEPVWSWIKNTVRARAPPMSKDKRHPHRTMRTTTPGRAQMVQTLRTLLNGTAKEERLPPMMVEVSLSVL